MGKFAEYFWGNGEIELILGKLGNLKIGQIFLRKWGNLPIIFGEMGKFDLFLGKLGKSIKIILGKLPKYF